MAREADEHSAPTTGTANDTDAGGAPPSLVNASATLAIAELAARRAGRLIRDAWETSRATSEVTSKGAVDLVTDTDEAAEVCVREILAETGIPVWGEEAGLSVGEEAAHEAHEASEEGPMWIVDPIDGTTNFSQRIPHFAVSIGLWWRGRARLGVVFDPVLNECFSAVGGVAWLNDRRLPKIRPPALDEAVLSTGFPYGRRVDPDNNLREFNALLLKTRSVQHTGSAALNMAYVAAGRLDGFWEADLKPWDLCAGIALVEGVGGVVTTRDGAPYWFGARMVVAAGAPLHEVLRAELVALRHPDSKDG